MKHPPPQAPANPRSATTSLHGRSDSALVALRRILRATELNARLLASQTGLTPSQLIVLQIIAFDGKALPSTVAKAARLTQATVTSLVDKLVEAALVVRQRDTEDRRRIWIHATEKGRKLLAESPDLLQDRFRVSFQELDDWEQAMIIAALERVSTLLDASTIDASPVLDTGDINR